MERTLIKDLHEHTGKEVTIGAIVSVVRQQGKMAFFDFRDRTSVIQGVVFGKPEVLEVAKEVTEESSLFVTGIVNQRPEKMVNDKVENGDIELEITGIEILNKSEVLPFPIRNDTKSINEMVRLKYRFLDLRSEKMHSNIINRSKVQKFIRDFLTKLDFFEIETPLLSAPTQEGSRSFVVPHRIWQGKFFSLPQSPQQYKQLLMCSGFEKYFQFAKCMRDEDSRGDRQPEFTQLDMELAFVNKEDVISLNENLLIDLVEKITLKKIQEVPFPRMTYKESMEKYGNDRPDIRTEKDDPNLLAFVWITDFPMFEETDTQNIDGTGKWTFSHNPFSKPEDSSMENFMSKGNIGEIISTQYDIVLNGFEIGGGSVRNHDPVKLKRTFEIMGYNEDRINKNFGHMLTALSFGCPPHAGIAWGFDRLMMILENEENIREVMAFPKTREGKDMLMESPSEINIEQALELGIKINKKDEDNINNGG